MNVRFGLALAIVALTGLGAAMWIVMRGPGGTSALGPVDGHHLPPTELDRVAAGDVAPDFSLRALSGEVITLSDSRGTRNVVLVFYRGHW